MPDSLDAAEPGTLRLGSMGNVDDYIFDAGDGQFHVARMFYTAQRHASFATFGGLLLHLLHEAGEG